MRRKLSFGTAILIIAAGSFGLWALVIGLALRAI